ncbi:hypothetical protein, partial [Thalassospira sp.]|uniref:hypothetical protein n=1 Tax=Thalassospira sp. TaxID=1912094 RepID=UPI00257CAEBD
GLPSGGKHQNGTGKQDDLGIKQQIGRQAQQARKESIADTQQQAEEKAGYRVKHQDGFQHFVWHINRHLFDLSVDCCSRTLPKSGKEYDYLTGNVGSN